MPSLQSITASPVTDLSPTALAGSKLNAGNGAVTKQTASDFEAMFLTMMLKEMRQTLEPGGLFSGDSGDVQGGLFDYFMGKHMADAGGVGLAAAILRQAQPESPTPCRRNCYNSRNCVWLTSAVRKPPFRPPARG